MLVQLQNHHRMYNVLLSRLSTTNEEFNKTSADAQTNNLVAINNINYSKYTLFHTTIIISQSVIHIVHCGHSMHRHWSQSLCPATLKKRVNVNSNRTQVQLNPKNISY